MIFSYNEIRAGFFKENVFLKPVSTEDEIKAYLD